MLKILLILVSTVCISLVTCFGLDNRIIGEGHWTVFNVEHCEDADQYEMVFTVGRKKMNRTHDCFHLSSDLDRELNLTYGISIDVFKEVDGGFKFYQLFADDCACDFIKKFAAENAKRALAMAGFDPPECPLTPRYFEINDFVMDYRELPQRGLFGKFKANAYLVYNGVRIGCVQVLLSFEPRNNEDHDNYDDYD